MRLIIKKILIESKDEWDWARSESLLPLSDYISTYNISKLEDLIGLQVMLSPKSEYYQEQIEYNLEDITNPINQRGEITDVNNDDYELPIGVKWTKPRLVMNTYSQFDLDVIID